MSPMLAGIWMGYLLGNAARSTPTPVPTEADEAERALELSQDRRNQRETMVSPPAPPEAKP